MDILETIGWITSALAPTLCVMTIGWSAVTKKRLQLNKRNMQGASTNAL
jgi:hypothetical protein